MVVEIIRSKAVCLKMQYNLFGERVDYPALFPEVQFGLVVGTTPSYTTNRYSINYLHLIS